MNPDNSFYGKSVAVTGKLDNYTRDGIQARLRELGAKPVSKVSKRTDYLILGERPGNKLVKALALEINILSEREFETMASQSKSSGAVSRSTTPLYV
ncbi:MAG: hypothetical protein HDT16_11025 [Oscillibacter sp.]|nr:hypothetical protein [Oscillibacter sp.]